MEATTTQRVTKRKGKGPTPIAKDVEIAPVRPIITTRVTAHVREVRPGAQQYRKHFDERALADLTESIGRTGIQSPPWVRVAEDGVGYELIAGERRWRAARAAGLEEISLDVKSYEGGERIDDEVALELSVLENNQREDPHPLEECDAFVALRDTYGHTAEQTAAKIKRSPGYVYERLALEGLGEPGRKAMWDGKIGLAVGHALSRIKHAPTQAEAVKELTRGLGEGEAVQVAFAKREIVRRWMLRIAEAPFSTSDETLVPKAGACTSCPKRSGNQGVLFEAGLGKEDVCTDIKCWDDKRVAGDKRLLEEAKASGKVVLTKDESKKHFSYGDHFASKSFVALDGTDYALTGNKSWRDVLGAKRLGDIETVYVQAPSGALLEVAKRSQVLAKVKATPAKSDTPGIKALRDQPTPAAAKPSERDAHSRFVIEERAAELALSALAALVENGSLAPDRDLELSRAIVQAFAAAEVENGDPWELERLFTRRAIRIPSWDVPEQDLKTQIAREIGELPIGRLRGLLVTLAARLADAFSDRDGRGSRKLLAIAGIEPSDFEHAATLELDQEREERKGSKKPAAKRGAADEGGDDGDE